MSTIRVPTILYCLIIVASFCTIWDWVNPYFVSYEIGQVVHYQDRGRSSTSTATSILSAPKTDHVTTRAHSTSGN